MTGKPNASKTTTSLASLVNAYWQDPEHGPKLENYLAYFSKLKSLDDAIRWAGYREDRKRIHGHQCLVGTKRLRRASQIMLGRIDQIRACKSFDELHDLICELTSNIKGFGVLARYDISLRIGANNDVWPDLIYLHAGTRKGCKALGVTITGKKLEMSALPKPLQILEPHHAENFLCIYKGSFGKLGRGSKSCETGRGSC